MKTKQGFQQFVKRRGPDYPKEVPRSSVRLLKVLSEINANNKDENTKAPPEDRK